MTRGVEPGTPRAECEALEEEEEELREAEWDPCLEGTAPWDCGL